MRTTHRSTWRFRKMGSMKPPPTYKTVSLRYISGSVRMVWSSIPTSRKRSSSRLLSDPELCRCLCLSWTYSWWCHADRGWREIVGRHTRSTPHIQQTHTECMQVVLLSHSCTEAHPVFTFGRFRKDNRVRFREFSTENLHGPGGPRAGPGRAGPGLDIKSRSRAGPGRAGPDL